ncbi:MAG: glycerophosphodiester phosphodiesterase family protein [Anaerolineales bacterium]
MRDWPRPLILAHRGASVEAPENTLAAFELALEQGAHGVELDAKLTVDGEVVVIHDPTVDRTTQGRGRVSQLTLAALQELDAGSFFSEKYSGEKIPTLARVFEAIGDRALINVELTNYKTPRDGLANKVCGLVKRFGLEERILFSSFLPSNLKRTRSLLPGIPRGLLALDGWPGWWARSFGFNFGDYQALHPNLRDTTPQQIARVHRLKRRVYVYTVNAVEDMRHLINWGVDGLITDNPKLAMDVISKKT